MRMEKRKTRAGVRRKEAGKGTGRAGKVGMLSQRGEYSEVQRCCGELLYKSILDVGVFGSSLEHLCGTASWHGICME